MAASREGEVSVGGAPAQPGEETAEQRWKRWETKKKKGVFTIAFLIFALDIAALLVGTEEWLKREFALGAIGIITFVGALVLVNYGSQDPEFTKKEVRKAIAAAFLVTYLALLSMVTFGTLPAGQTELAAKVVTHFTWITGIIIGFYFGSRAVEAITEAGKNKNKDTN